jgi:ParB-like chromosome segregation protein Spo0J
MSRSPPPDIRRYSGQHYIEDGHHRIEAAKELGLKKIPMWLEY